MQEAAFPSCEHDRLAALLSYQVLDTPAEQAFDDLTRMAAVICGTPIALVSLVDDQRQWFKSRVGLDAPETPRQVAFCSHAILAPDDVLVVPDARRDPRFHDNPLVTAAPYVIFYAGAPLVSPDGQALGTLCVIDDRPRQIDEQQVMMLRILARQVVNQLELSRTCLELQTLSARLTEANAELEDFSSIAAHDLQEPLHKIVAFGDLLSRELGSDIPPRAAEELALMIDGTKRMQRLISDLLELSHTSSTELRFERLELAECVRDVLQRLSLRVEETGAEVTCDPLPALMGDRTLLTQLYQNLVANALKFSRPDRPRVHLTCEQQGGRTVFGVRDNGIGIAPEHLERIFEPFRRLHGRGQYEGSGIGLTVARKAVARHGGTLWVESEPGRGSHFRFTLPGVPTSSLGIGTQNLRPADATGAADAPSDRMPAGQVSPAGRAP